MNKKVKWSIVSVTSASLVAFAGLVAGNTEKEADKNAVAANFDARGQDSDAQIQENFSDIPDSNNSNGSGTEEGGQFFRGHDHSGEQGQSGQDSGSSQDRYYQAPSGGFKQGAGSSG